MNKIHWILCGLFLGFGFVVAIYVYAKSRTIERQNNTYSEASKEYIVRKWIPDTATNIDFWASPGRHKLCARFGIQEDEFKSWIEDQGWTLVASAPERAEQIKNVYSVEDGPNGNVVIERGYVFRTKKSGQSIQVGYDIESKVAYFSIL